jgi:hypothetical protein
MRRDNGVYFCTLATLSIEVFVLAHQASHSGGDRRAKCSPKESGIRR